MWARIILLGLLYAAHALSTTHTLCARPFSSNLQQNNEHGLNINVLDTRGSSVVNKIEPGRTYTLRIQRDTPFHGLQLQAVMDGKHLDGFVPTQHTTISTACPHALLRYAHSPEVRTIDIRWRSPSEEVKHVQFIASVAARKTTGEEVWWGSPSFPIATTIAGGRSTALRKITTQGNTPEVEGVLASALNGGFFQSCGSSTHQPGADCENVFDGITTNSWISSGEGVGAFIEITLSIPFFISTIGYQTRIDSGVDNPTSVFNRDVSIYFYLGEQVVRKSKFTTEQTTNLQFFELEQTFLAERIRLEILDTNVDTNRESAGLSAFQLFGVPFANELCQTIVPDEFCIFPFKYSQVVYNSCTTTDNGNNFWCATSVDQFGNYDGQWRNCAEQNFACENKFTGNCVVQGQTIANGESDFVNCKVGRCSCSEGIPTCSGGCRTPQCDAGQEIVQAPPNALGCTCSICRSDGSCPLTNGNRLPNGQTVDVGGCSGMCTCNGGRLTCTGVCDTNPTCPPGTAPATDPNGVVGCGCKICVPRSCSANNQCGGAFPVCSCSVCGVLTPVDAECASCSVCESGTSCRPDAGVNKCLRDCPNGMKHGETQVDTSGGDCIDISCSNGFMTIEPRCALIVCPTGYFNQRPIPGDVCSCEECVPAPGSCSSGIGNARVGNGDSFPSLDACETNCLCTDGDSVCTSVCSRIPPCPNPEPIPGNTCGCLRCPDINVGCVRNSDCPNGADGALGWCNVCGNCGFQLMAGDVCNAAIFDPCGLPSCTDGTSCVFPPIVPGQPPQVGGGGVCRRQCSDGDGNTINSGDTLLTENCLQCTCFDGAVGCVPTCNLCPPSKITVSPPPGSDRCACPVCVDCQSDLDCGIHDTCQCGECRPFVTEGGSCYIDPDDECNNQNCEDAVDGNVRLGLVCDINNVVAATGRGTCRRLCEVDGDCGTDRWCRCMMCTDKRGLGSTCTAQSNINSCDATRCLDSLECNADNRCALRGGCAALQDNTDLFSACLDPQCAEILENVDTVPALKQTACYCLQDAFRCYRQHRCFAKDSCLTFAETWAQDETMNFCNVRCDDDHCPGHAENPEGHCPWKECPGNALTFAPHGNQCCLGCGRPTRKPCGMTDFVNPMDFLHACDEDEKCMNDPTDNCHAVDCPHYCYTMILREIPAPCVDPWADMNVNVNINNVNGNCNNGDMLPGGEHSNNLRVRIGTNGEQQTSTTPESKMKVQEQPQVSGASRKHGNWGGHTKTKLGEVNEKHRKHNTSGTDDSIKQQENKGVDSSVQRMINNWRKHSSHSTSHTTHDHFTKRV